ncbi:P-loop containing nucleoside triphosphate hydrolase protein, partial [Suillus subaureus]
TKTLDDLHYHQSLSTRLKSLLTFHTCSSTGPSGAGTKTRISCCTLRQLFGSCEAGNYDRVVIQDLLKEIAQTQQVDLNAKHRFKVVVINEADSLSRDAQAALRRTMEKYMSNMRIILCANSTSKLIAPIKSRCLLMRVAAPNPKE